MAFDALHLRNVIQLGGILCKIAPLYLLRHSPDLYPQVSMEGWLCSRLFKFTKQGLPLCNCRTAMEPIILLYVLHVLFMAYLHSGDIIELRRSTHIVATNRTVVNCCSLYCRCSV